MNPEDLSLDELRQLTRSAMRQVANDGDEWGKLGVLGTVDAVETYIFYVPGFPKYVYCRIEREGELEPSICIPMVALDPFVRIKFMRANGVLVAIDPDFVDAANLFNQLAAAMRVPTYPMSDRGGSGDLTPGDGNILLGDGQGWASTPLSTVLGALGWLRTGDAVARTIASGVITTGAESVIVMQAQTGTADDLDTITLTGSPRLLLLIADAGDDITLKDGVDNIFLNSGADQIVTSDQVLLVYHDGVDVRNISLGGTGSASPLTTIGDLYTYDGVDARLPVGADGQFLSADSGEATGLKWAGFPAGAGAYLTVDTTPVGNVGVGEDDLISFSVPANTLATNGDYLHGVTGGNFASSLNNKRLRAKLGSTTFFDTGTLAITTATDWALEWWIYRITSSTQVIVATFTSSSATLAGFAQTTSAAEDLTTALTVKCTGEATANNDVQQETLSLETYSAGGGAAGGGYILIRDEKTQNTAGGTFTAGAQRTRDLNTEVVDTGGNASLSSNQITLAAGTYRALIKCPAISVDQHQARLYNTTDAAVVLLGTSEYSNGDIVTSSSLISGRFTIAAGKVLEVQHQSSATRATQGFGVQANVSTEIYTVVELWKE